MNSDRIRKVFSEAGIVIPADIESHISDCDYDGVENWCCGLAAVRTPDGVIVAAYCHRGRGGEKKQIFISTESSKIFDCPPLAADWTLRDHTLGIVSINSRKGEA